MTLFRFPIVIQDLPDRELQHHLEGEQLIIHVGVDYTKAEVRQLKKEIVREYQRQHQQRRRTLIPLIPIPAPRGHTAAWSGIAAATAITATAMMLAVTHTPSPEQPTAEQPAPVVEPRDTPVAAPSRITSPTLRPRQSSQHRATRPAVSPSPTQLVRGIVRSTAGDHPIRATVGEHPIRAAVGDQPIRRATPERAAPQRHPLHAPEAAHPAALT
jgi:hypothetical protein